jgi:uncharacterized protein
MTDVETDVIVVGAGLAGLVATAELAAAGRRVILVEQEPEAGFGGQAWWSLGGLFLVDTPEQRRLRIRDSRETAGRDWTAAAGFDRDEDHWPRRWAEAYLDFAAGEKRAWLRSQGVGFFPIVGWAERRWNSVPRFHLTWGTGPAVVSPFAGRVREAEVAGRVELRFRHRVDELTVEAGAVTGVAGTILEPSDLPRGMSSSRSPAGTFALRAGAVIVAAGGIGGNHDLVRAAWPERLGTPPRSMLTGVPAHVDGRMLAVAQAAGGAVVNPDRMWHYTEGITNWSPIWPNHGIRILPGPSSLWLDALGRRLPAPLFPGFDTLGTMAQLRSAGHDHSWFILSQRVIEKEFALSGSEQNPDLTGKSVRLVLKRILPGAPGPVESFKRRGADFVVADGLPALVEGMNRLTDAPLDLAEVQRQLVERDDALGAEPASDAQLAAVQDARRFLGERLVRVAKLHRLTDPKAGPLIGVKLHVLTRKTLGGLHTDLDARVLDPHGDPVPGLFAAGEVAGFGGGGMHGYRALEGSFLGGCLFSGRVAGRAAAGG